VWAVLGGWFFGSLAIFGGCRGSVSGVFFRFVHDVVWLHVGGILPPLLLESGDPVELVLRWSGCPAMLPGACRGC